MSHAAHQKTNNKESEGKHFIIIAAIAFGMQCCLELTGLPKAAVNAAASSSHEYSLLHNV